MQISNFTKNYERDLNLKNYAQNTIKNYVCQINMFLRNFEGKDSPKHTYTKIPATLKNNIYFLYINCIDLEGFVLNLKDRDIVIGAYEAQKSGDFLNTTC